MTVYSSSMGNVRLCDLGSGTSPCSLLHVDLHLTVNRPKEHSGTLIAPKNLREHRGSHDFLGPSCLCPALSIVNTPQFVEADILERGDIGFVAICPTDSCGYLGT